MQALRAQMNPHFIFNCLNAINGFILVNDSETAANYLVKFSRLIRMVLNNSARKFISLDEDMETLDLYLQLERLRFTNNFHYKINCDDNIDTSATLISPMLLQPFAENAIWHGLMPREGEGHLSINIQQEDSTLVCTIIDDGIGRKKAAELKDRSANHKSMGMKITESRIAIMHGENGSKTAVTINDLVNPGGTAAGTEVIIRMPVMTV